MKVSYACVYSAGLFDKPFSDVHTLPIVESVSSPTYLQHAKFSTSKPFPHSFTNLYKWVYFGHHYVVLATTVYENGDIYIMCNVCRNNALYIE